MNKTLPPLPIEALLDRLIYAPATGAITWKKTHGRYARAGELAGTLTKRGDVIVTVLGRKLPGTAVAWAMGRGRWPDRPLYTLDGDKENLRLLNIATRERARPVAAATLQAYEQRDAREQKRVDTSQYPNISWDEAKRKWVVRDSADIIEMLRLDRHGDRRVRGRFDDADAAIDCALEIESLAQIAYTFTPDPALADAVTPNGIRYAELASLLAYDPPTGLFVWCSGSATGQRADIPEFRAPNSKRYVPYASTRLWAHLLAWFYTTGEWPPRKRFAPIDGNYGNLTAINLSLL